MTGLTFALALLGLPADNAPGPVPRFLYQHQGYLAQCPNALEFSGDGSAIVGCSDSTLFAIDAQTGGTLAQFSGPPNNFVGESVALTPDGRTLLTAHDYGGFVTWDRGTRRAARFLPIAGAGDDGAFTKLAVAPTGGTVATLGNGVLRLWEPVLFRVTLSIPAAGLRSVRFTPDGKEVVAAGGGRVRVWDVRTGAVRAGIEWKLPEDAACSPRPRVRCTDRHIAVEALWVTVVVWDRELKREVARAKGSTFCLTPDGQYLISRLDDEFLVTRIDAGRVVRRTKAVPGGVVEMAVSPDGSILAVGADWGVLSGHQLADVLPR